MPLAARLRKLREEKGLSLDEVARKAEISKTYLWELERDTEGTKKPSAAILLRIANALSTSLADLLSLPTVRVAEREVEIPPGLQELRQTMETQGKPLSEDDIRDLAGMKFRGGQPQSLEEWQQLYLLMVNAIRRRER